VTKRERKKLERDRRYRRIRVQGESYKGRGTKRLLRAAEAA
jgi:hypothetical protein